MNNNSSSVKNKFSIPSWAYLAVVLFLALFMRLAGIWRTEPIDYHPDEWVIAKPVFILANEGQVGLKNHYKWPACSVIYSLGYGLYALKGWFGPYSYNNILIIQRVLSAVAGTIMVLVAFLLMRKMFSVQTALFSATLLSVAKLPVLQGHYGTITGIVSLVIITVLLLSFDLFDVKCDAKRCPKVGRSCLLGFICGFGIAAKWTVLFAVIPISGAFLLSLWFNRRLTDWGHFAKINLQQIAIITVMSILGFLIGLPDFQLAPKKVVSGLTYEIKHQKTGHYGSVTSERENVGPRIWRTFRLLNRGGSIYLLIPAIVAIAYCVLRPSRWRLLLIYTMLLWLGMLCRNKLGGERHHLVPFIIMVLLLSVGLGVIVNDHRKWFRFVGYGFFVFLVCMELLYTCIWISPFWKPDARVECSNWIKTNVPQGSGVTWAPRTPTWAAPGGTVEPSLFSIYPREARAGNKQYIMAAHSRLKIFKKHPLSRKIVPSEWFPQKPPTQGVLALYEEMNTGGGPNLTLVKKFYTRPSFLGLDLRLFGIEPDIDTTFANQSVSLFRFNKPLGK